MFRSGIVYIDFAATHRVCAGTDSVVKGGNTWQLHALKVRPSMADLQQ